MVWVAPSVLSADFGRLGEQIDMLNRSAADFIHCDVMDGHFVPNISFGLPVIRAIKQRARKPLDVHLMITDPNRFVPDFIDAGADMLTVHWEACTHLHRTLDTIRQRGVRAGVAINPHTPVMLLTEILDQADLVCLMGVNPGFGGQQLIPTTWQRLRQLSALIQERGLGTRIEVDGGVDLTNAAALIAQGAHILVAGHAVFHSENPEQTIWQLKHATHTVSV